MTIDFNSAPRQDWRPAAHRILSDVGRERLSEVAADIIGGFLGPPSLSTRKEMRWGAKGSFALVIAGSMAGYWYDHELGSGGDVITFIMIRRSCSFAEALDYAGQFVSELRSEARVKQTFIRRDDDDNDEQRIGRALGIWSETQPLRGTLAEQYLRSRCIEVLDEALEVLRFHPTCTFGNFGLPTMVALVRDIVTNEPIGIHRTPLTDDGRKLGHPKVMGPKRDGAIKLSGDVFAGELTIAEGVETALSATLLGFSPSWSVIDAGNLARFPVLPSIERLTIAVDNDASGAGQRSAAACKARWEGAGLRVRTVMPPTPGHDLNDVLQAGGR